MFEEPVTCSGRVRTADQLELYWQSWSPPNPGGVIVVIHGLAEHSGRYRETAEFLCNHGWAVYAFDLRGHGLSQDPPQARRVHVDHFTDYFHDVEAIIRLAREAHAGLPLFILGHSMGGLIAISYILKTPGPLAGAIISSPALGTHPQFRPPLFLKLLVVILSRLAPRLLVNSDLDTQAISRDPKVVLDYVNDPLISNKVSVRWYSEILQAMNRAHENAPALQIPILLMQSGADRLVDPAAPGRWATAVPPGLVELVLWEGLYHEMLNEPEKNKVRARILTWLDHQTNSPVPYSG
jgi:alpha-beta hydrolase superfamily lysophospholipase